MIKIVVLASGLFDSLSNRKDPQKGYQEGLDFLSPSLGP